MIEKIIIPIDYFTVCIESILRENVFQEDPMSKYNISEMCRRGFEDELKYIPPAELKPFRELLRENREKIFKLYDGVNEVSNLFLRLWEDIYKYPQDKYPQDKYFSMIFTACHNALKIITLLEPRNGNKNLMTVNKKLKKSIIAVSKTFNNNLADHMLKNVADYTLGCYWID